MPTKVVENIGTKLDDFCLQFILHVEWAAPLYFPVR